MIKIHILIPCKYYQGPTYLLIGETASFAGKVYTQYAPCPNCQGSGN